MVERPQPRRLWRESLGIFSAQVAITMVGVGTGVIVARTLDPSTPLKSSLIRNADRRDSVSAAMSGG